MVALIAGLTARRMPACIKQGAPQRRSAPGGARAAAAHRQYPQFVRSLYNPYFKALSRCDRAYLARLALLTAMTAPASPLSIKCARFRYIRDICAQRFLWLGMSAAPDLPRSSRFSVEGARIAAPLAMLRRVESAGQLKQAAVYHLNGSPMGALSHPVLTRQVSAGSE